MGTKLGEFHFTGFFRVLILAIFMITLIVIIGRAKRAPHWGVQSRFRVIYIMCVYVYDCLWETHTKKMVCQNAWAELRGPNTRMLTVSFVSLKQSAAWNP